MLAPFNLWKQWSDRAIDSATDFWARSFALNRLAASEPPRVAQTPSDVAYTENKLRLLHYRPVTERQYAVPVLLVPSIINRYYILDLKPGRSLVEYLRDHNFDVWMIDWGIPGDEDKFITLDDYIDGYLLNGVHEVLSASGQPQLTLLAQCIGGVLTTIFTALHGDLVKNLINLAAPIEFRDDGLLSLWARKEYFPVDWLIDSYGNMPAWLLQTSFKWLKPTTDLNNAWNLWERLDDPDRVENFRALARWTNDNVPVAGEAFRKFVKDCYQENLLVQNRMTINGRVVDLRAIRCALLNVTARDDHICPPRSAAVLNDSASGVDKTLLNLSGGHIGMVTGQAALNGLWPRLVEWLGKRSGVMR